MKAGSHPQSAAVPQTSPPPAAAAPSQSAAGHANASATAPLAAVPRRPSHRERVLDAAEHVVREDGAAHVTIEAVAERAGLSKGGLLYHFKTKEALLQAMIDRHMQSLGVRHAAALASLPPGPGQELKAWALVSSGHEKNAADQRMGCSMLAAAANDPRLIAPFHEFQQRRLRSVQETAAAGLPFARAALLMLALDGLGLLELHQLSPYDTAQRQAILAEIVQLIDETAAAAGVAETTA